MVRAGTSALLARVTMAATSGWPSDRRSTRSSPVVADDDGANTFSSCQRLAAWPEAPETLLMLPQRRSKDAPVRKPSRPVILELAVGLDPKSTVSSTSNTLPPTALRSAMIRLDGGESELPTALPPLAPPSPLGPSVVAMRAPAAPRSVSITPQPTPCWGEVENISFKGLETTPAARLRGARTGGPTPLSGSVEALCGREAGPRGYARAVEAGASA
mmetsp:Transcript_2525/g.5623  ORF Transcript_2525/g.5623 Transcript_2525/m.5623 type:complete len:216 (-) Transcript_2525:74-721(-)